MKEEHCSRSWRQRRLPVQENPRTYVRGNYYRSLITCALLNFVITWTTRLRKAIRAILAFSPSPPLAKPADSAPELAELSVQSSWSVPGPGVVAASSPDSTQAMRSWGPAYVIHHAPQGIWCPPPYRDHPIAEPAECPEYVKRVAGH